MVFASTWEHASGAIIFASKEQWSIKFCEHFVNFLGGIWISLYWKAGTLCAHTSGIFEWASVRNTRWTLKEIQGFLIQHYEHITGQGVPGAFREELKRQQNADVCFQGAKFCHREILMSMRAVGKILRARAGRHSCNFCEQFTQRPNFRYPYLIHDTTRKHFWKIRFLVLARKRVQKRSLWLNSSYNLSQMTLRSDFLVLRCHKIFEQLLPIQR